MLFKIVYNLRVQIFIAACFNLSELINGYGVAWIAPVLPKFDDLDQSPLPYKITDLQKAWIVPFLFFGFVGTFPAGYFANRIGRKKSLVLGAVLHLASYILLNFANNVTILYISKFMTGLSMNIMMVLGTIFIGEIASPNIRGVILTSMGVSHAVGSLLVYAVGPFVDFASVTYIALSLNVGLVIACCFLPESPMFYVLKDDETSARAVLQLLGRHADINGELKTMMEKVREQRSNEYIWKELFKLKSNRRSLFITMTLTGFQQGSGIMAVIMYANTIFKYTSSSIQPDVAAIIVGATFVVGAFVTPLFVDKYGRRILLLLSTAGLCLTMTGLGAYFYLRLIKPSSVENLGWVPLALLVSAQFAYSLGLSIIPNTILGELFTPRVRGLGPPLSISTGMVSGLISTSLFSYVVLALGIHFTFWLFATCNAFAFLFVIFFVPETMGKSLMQIQDMLNVKG